MLTCNAKLTWLSVRHLGFIRPRRRTYFSARMKYYPNTVASLRLARLTIAGAIEPFSARVVECGLISSAVVSQRKISLYYKQEEQDHGTVKNVFLTSFRIL